MPGGPAADCPDMSAIDPISASPSQASAAAQANAAAATTSAADAKAKLGLPPVQLAAAASTNTINAELATSQWGVDPASVGGVYGGGNQDGGMFAGTSLLSTLSSLSPATAEQSLSLLGISMPAPKVASADSEPQATASGTPANSPTDNAALQASAGGAGPAIVDPLWGRSA